MKATIKALAAAGLAALANAASAAPTVTIDSVAQRWPWNNKIDITYTVSGGQDVAAGVFARIVFTAHIGGTDYTIDGVHHIGASASDGQHTVTWTAPSGLKASGCTVTADLLSADNPSGDDYMVVDLGTGTVSYEGLLATQADSNGRYTNNAAFKNDKLVLRKIPAWAARSQLPNASALSSLAGYPTGMDDDVDGASSSATLKNSRAYWQTARAYYIGIFPVTQEQYKKIYGSNPAPNWRTYAPVYGSGVTWNALRLSTTAPTNRIPAVSSFTGTFFQRLNYRTGLYFDLPTELTWEIAARAGATTKYPWGSSANSKYYVCRNDLPSGYTGPLAVGAKLPNDWGLYDMIGNIFEWCLDDNSRSNLAEAENPFTPASSNMTNRIVRGANYESWGGGAPLRPSLRQSENAGSDQWGKYGFRVAFIVPERGFRERSPVMKHTLLVCAAFLAGARALHAADGNLLASTASPSPAFEVWTVDGAAYPVADAAAIAALPRVTWLAGDTVTATSCLGASSTLASAAATAGSAAFAPSAGGVWTLENSVQGSARIGVPWTVFGDGGLLDSSAASPEFAVDAQQNGPDRKTKARDVLPVSYTGDHWVGGLESATLTFTPPSGDPTVLERSGTGAEDFRFSVPGVWTVTLEMADGATLESRLTVAEEGLLIFVR